MVELSSQTERLVRAIIPAMDQARIKDRLLKETSGDLGFCEGTPEGMERIRFSILRLVHINPINEDIAFKLAKVDTRDLFMAAEHGYQVDAHLEWARSILK